MNGDFFTESEWMEGLQNPAFRWLDVRAEVEFGQGAIPGAVNFPILNNEERHLVGTAYKQQGPDVAVRLGHELVRGAKREERTQAWARFFEENAQAGLYCFRGGQRSSIAQAWTREVLGAARGARVRRIEGGYKRVRQHLLEQLEKTPPRLPLKILSGRTGSGKTALLRQILAETAGQAKIIDLEGLARHRGSAFGKELDPQPAQAQFENELAVKLLRVPAGPEPLWLEDESRMIGQITLPETFYRTMIQAPLYVIEESVESRARITFKEYVLDAFAQRSAREGAPAFQSLREGLKAPIHSISRRIGGLRTAQYLRMIDDAMDESERNGNWEAHLEWIRSLLQEYYDPYYEKHLQRQAGRIVFRGSRAEILERVRSGKLD